MTKPRLCGAQGAAEGRAGLPAHRIAVQRRGSSHARAAQPRCGHCGVRCPPLPHRRQPAQGRVLPAGRLDSSAGELQAPAWRGAGAHGGAEGPLAAAPRRSGGRRAGWAAGPGPASGPEQAAIGAAPPCAPPLLRPGPCRTAPSPPAGSARPRLCGLPPRGRRGRGGRAARPRRAARALRWRRLRGALGTAADGHLLPPRPQRSRALSGLSGRARPRRRSARLSAAAGGSRGVAWLRRPGHGGEREWEFAPISEQGECRAGRLRGILIVILVIIILLITIFFLVFVPLYTIPAPPPWGRVACGAQCFSPPSEGVYCLLVPPFPFVRLSRGWGEGADREVAGGPTEVSAGGPAVRAVAAVGTLSPCAQGVSGCPLPASREDQWPSSPPRAAPARRSRPGLRGQAVASPPPARRHRL